MGFPRLRWIFGFALQARVWAFLLNPCTYRRVIARHDMGRSRPHDVVRACVSVCRSAERLPNLVNLAVVLGTKTGSPAIYFVGPTATACVQDVLQKRCGRLPVAGCFRRLLGCMPFHVVVVSESSAALGTQSSLVAGSRSPSCFVE